MTTPHKSPGARSFATTGAVLLTQLAYAAEQVISLLLSRQLWMADLASFIRPHLLLVGVVLFVVGMALSRPTTRIGGLVALFAAILPYALLPSPAPDLGGRVFTLVSANVLVDNRDPRPFLSIPAVASADILVLQEMRPHWQDALGASGYWPHESSRDLRANTDMKVFSRFPILSERTVSPESRDTGGRHPVRLELVVEGRPVILYAIHPQTPRRPSMWRERTAYFRDLTAALRSEPADAAVIVAGDWNTPPWSPFFRDFLSSTGYRTTDSRWWPTPTRFSIRFGGITWLGTPIDRVVLSQNVGLVELDVGPQFGSNHLPVISRLSIP